MKPRMSRKINKPEQVVALTADNVKNLGGRILGTDAAVAARADLDNLGGA